MYFSASLVDALRRGRRGDFAGRRGKAALALTAVSWAILGVIKLPGRHHPRPGAGGGVARPTRRRLRRGPGHAARRPGPPAADGAPCRWRNTVARRRYVEKTNVVSYGPHGRANLADIWRRRRPAARRQGAGAGAGARRRMGDRHAPAPGLSADEPPGRARLGVRVDRLPGFARGTPGPTTSSTSNARWRGSRRTSPTTAGIRSFVAITGGSAGGHLSSLAALTPNDPTFQPGFEDADTSVVAAVPMYGRYDWFSTEGEGRREFVDAARKVRCQTEIRHRTATSTSTPRRSGGCSRRTALLRPARPTTIPSSRWARRRSSSTSCARCRSPRSPTPNYRTPNTLSTSSVPRGRIDPPRPSRGFCRGCTRRTRPSATSVLSDYFGAALARLVERGWYGRKLIKIRA